MKHPSHWMGRVCLLLVGLAPALFAHADVTSGMEWLRGRESPAGVHRIEDLAGAADTNAEAYTTIARLSRSADFPATVGLAREQRDETLLSLARLAHNRIDLGQSAADQFDELLAEQGEDGGFPALPGLQSEPLTTAWVLLALDRAGRGGETEAARALGYLIASQQTDGGWLAAPANTSHVIPTARAAQVLYAFRNRFALTQPIARSLAFLQSARQPDNTFGEAFQTAVVLEALVDLGVDRATLAPIATALSMAQSTDGSFEGDAYVTALALRALWLFEQPVVEPMQAGLTGRVLSADTGLPISGATLALGGTAVATLTSNDSGHLQSASLIAGSYLATLSYPGMHSIEFELSLADGRILDLGDLRMYQGDAGANLAIVRGRITRAADGAPIPGASILIEQPPIQVSSGGDGSYQILQVPAGHVRIIVSAAGYSSRFAEVDIGPSAVIEFSVALQADANATGATVRGTIVDGVTGDALAGVSVAIVAGAPPVATTTDASGSYGLLSEASPLVTLVASLSGYDPVSVSAPLGNNEVLVFSPRMYPEGQTPEGANQARVFGTIVNQANRQPIENALIVASDPGGQHVARTDSAGAFSLSGVSGPVTRLAISADAFDPATLAVPLQPLEVRDLGEIGLKPTALAFYFPDLVLVESTLSETDPDHFDLDRAFTLSIANRGTSSTTQDFDVIAFVDANGNGSFDSGLEPEIGRTRVDQDLPVGGSTEVDIAVAAQLTFRDAPVAFWIDADNEIPEQDEDNNVGTSLLGCRVTPSFVGNDSVEEFWRWDGLSSNPQINSLNATPSVVQLTDDNGDGVINEYDTPDLVFVAGLRNSIAPGQTALVALDGRTGAELWSRTDIRLSQFASPATGDIDNDGVAEIIVVRGYRQELIAFENDGTLKWRTTMNGPREPAPIFPPAPFVFDQPIIVNLEGDNEAEVVLGRAAFRGLTGEQLWEGEFDAGGTGGKPIGSPLRVAGSVASVAADIDLDGRVEVIAGRTAYDFEGRTLWHRDDIKPIPITDANEVPMNYSGYVAIGNFDSDDFAEIVLSINDELWLLEHTGETIWGPVHAPDFTAMGAPTVADIDDDGLPEIIVSSLHKLTVFESDGTVKRTFDIDDPSGVTSATVFDFENDGLLEVVHTDEHNLRILDARTLVQRFITANSSVTVYEVPVVADLDGDKQAEIIVTGFDRDLALATPGIRVFKARNGAWADAGSAWGSAAFHVNEINEDSTLPLIETPSWLTHNTYRVQQSPLPDPLGMPDFTVGDLRLIDQGAGHNPAVQVRVGNAGPVDAHEPPYISIYRGDPAAGGTLLTEQRLDTLRPARFQIVNLGEISVAGSGDLHAVVDQRNRARECRESNNERSIPFLATNGRGDLQLATDSLTYEPGAIATLTATVSNLGVVAAGYSVEWFIRNAQGVVTASLDDQVITEIPAGGTVPRSLEWSTQGVLAGNYVLEGRLHDSQGAIADTATVSFAISGDFTGPAGTVSLSTPRSEYAAGEAIRIDYVAGNLSSSEVIRLPEVAITISGPAGFVQTRSFLLDDLFANASIAGEMGVDGAAAAGEYTAVARLRSRLTGYEYATDTITFQRLPDTSASIEGFVSIARPSLLIGEPQTCLFTVRNRGTAAQPDAHLRKRMVALDGGTVEYEQLVIVDLVPGADYVASELLPTSGLAAGEHACLVEIDRGAGDWRILDSESFTLIAPAAAAILVDPVSGLVTSEAGQSATFNVSLASQPAAEVRIPVMASDAAEWSLPGSEIVFTPATWDVPRAILVDGVDDALVDGDQAGFIRLLPAQSADAAYAGLDASDVSIVNLDDDSAEILVSPTTITTSEAGTSASFVVRLNAAPDSSVQIDLVNPDPDEWSLPLTTLTLDGGNWQAGMTVQVTGVDDTDFDGTQTGVLQLLPAVSQDPVFNGLDPVDVALSNTDDEQADVLVDPLQVTTSESGTADSFVVRLNRMPSAEVVVPIGPVDASEWQVLETEIRLDAGNWQSGYSVAVNPVDDDLVDGDQSALLSLGPAQSTDTAFAGIDPPDVTLLNLDNDSARIVVAPTTGLIVDENGASASFFVALTTAPTDDVHVPLASGDPGEFAIAESELVFTPQDWSARTVVVTGVDDAEADGNIVGAIVIAAALSDDAHYAGINPPDVSVTNLDNEAVQVVVDPETRIETSETGTQATVSVHLSVPPTDPVRIDLVNPDNSEWSLDTDSLVFPAGSGTSVLSFTVTGVDDAEVDGDIIGVIGLQPVVSDDPRYQGIDPPDLNAVNRDDDVVVAPTWQIVATDLDVSEVGDTGLLQIAFDRLPSADVHVEITSADPSEVVADPVDLVFTAANATTAQPVILHGLDDDVADGTRDVALTLRVSASDDNQFAAMPAQFVTAHNLDDDVAAIRLSLAGPQDLTEGDSTELQLSLGSRPVAPVTLTLAAAVESPADPNSALIELEPQVLTIEPPQWEGSNAVILRTFNNGTVDGLRIIGIRVAAVESADPGYAALGSDPVFVDLDDAEGLLVTPIPVPGNGRLALALLSIFLLLLGSAAIRSRQTRRA